ncbi:ferric ion ABC transporter permease [Jeotgalibacillus alimentarius]|uniref:Ferric ion ABC transporter permease n=2 Tax=Jeotgalibacillus alimentarius TaxID=135826 RepID=A0A0C2RQN6_9BACL|nr:iron ABC transporter permease [Jeotgalibacillus alimentarius]KIL44034.1 ferric ion ABC transporter permease [Jeotgalibacillus alimentarius]
MFSRNKVWTGYTFSILLLLTAFTLGVTVGSVQVPLTQMLNIFAGAITGNRESLDPMFSSIVLDIRFPRVVLAALVGASLAIAGASFQGLLKNPLADPYTLGVSSGASVGAVATIFLGLTIPGLGSFTLPVISILAALITLVIVLGFARMVEKSMKMETIILTGIIFSSFLGSILSLMIALTGDELRQIINWLLGSVSMRGWEYIRLIAPFFVIGALLLFWNARELNAMAFGEERAQHLGVNVQRRKFVVLASGSLLTGAAVAVSGTIGFVGLVVPHMVRMVTGSDHRHVLPLSILNGASLLILCDLVARTIVAPTELPIGVITALIGAPVFGLILIQRRKERRG